MSKLKCAMPMNFLLLPSFVFIFVGNSVFLNQGVSTTTDIDALQKEKYEGKPCFYVEVIPQKIPSELRIVLAQPPSGHHVIGPAVDMPLSTFRGLLNSLKVSEIKFRAAADPHWDKYNPDEFMTMNSIVHMLARILYLFLLHEKLDDFEQDLVANLIGRLRKREFSDVKELTPWEIELIIKLVELYIIKEELTVNPENFVETEILDESLASYRRLRSHLKSILPTPKVQSTPPTVITAPQEIAKADEIALESFFSDFDLLSLQKKSTKVSAKYNMDAKRACVLIYNTTFAEDQASDLAMLLNKSVVVSEAAVAASLHIVFEVEGDVTVDEIKKLPDRWSAWVTERGLNYANLGPDGRAPPESNEVLKLEDKLTAPDIEIVTGKDFKADFDIPRAASPIELLHLSLEKLQEVSRSKGWNLTKLSQALERTIPLSPFSDLVIKASLYIYPTLNIVALVPIYPEVPKLAEYAKKEIPCLFKGEMPAPEICHITGKPKCRRVYVYNYGVRYYWTCCQDRHKNHSEKI